MMEIDNWLNKPIPICKSKGGVLALLNPFDNLVVGNTLPWPPPEIVQKLYKSNHESAFMSKIIVDSKFTLGFYSDLQSIHSEDAITWSVFGTAKYFPKKERNLFIEEFQNIIGLRCNSFQNSKISLWRRLPHPETLVSGGPEIDFLIQTDDTLILGEAKWKSLISMTQGKNRNKDQIQLRVELLEKYGAKFFPTINNFIVVHLSLEIEPMTRYLNGNIQSVSITWDQVCSMNSHLFSKELNRYLNWKKMHSKNV